MGLFATLAYLVILAITGLIVFLLYKNWKIGKYFRDMGVPYQGVGMKRLAQMFLGNHSIFDIEQLIYQDAVATGSPVVGYNDSFVNRLHYISDLDVAKHIYVKDFDHFVNRRQFASKESNKLLTRMLIGLESQEWKGMRSKLSPIFTTGKIKRMFGIFDNSSQRMCNFVRKQVGSLGDIDICEAYSKYAMDVIASCAFGVDSKSFEVPVGTSSEFEKMGAKLQFRFDITVFLKFVLTMIAPKVADALGIEGLFDAAPQHYFRGVIKEVMKRRRETGERQDDFLQLMMDAQLGLLKGEENSKEVMEVMTGHTGGGTGKKVFTEEASLDDEDIVANCVLFLVGGFDTTQSLLLFATYQLALEQDVQEKLFQEVRASVDANGGKLSYDGVLHMNYLDMFIHEALRYFPPAGRTERMCTKDYKIPGTQIVIKKGTFVALPILGVHRDPKYYSCPEKFDPYNFLPERKSKRHPYSFSPFGHGPRNCIGMRFAMNEVKAVIATIVYNFKLEPCSRTEIPMKFGKSSSLKPANGMWLKMSSRKEV